MMLLAEKIPLKKRAFIETVNDKLKNMCQVEHTRHRSFNNFTCKYVSSFDYLFLLA
ncbi:hypothetical protein HX049_17935 [Myroides odoratimimus]|nr:hypothetical protein [Myroides odoratimimus]